MTRNSAGELFGRPYPLGMAITHVALIGMPGVGKSAVGTHLAARLGIADVDLDAQIELRVGRSIPEIFEFEGEDRFRALEQAALVDALADADSVISCGGGLTTNAASFTLLYSSDVTVVWLTAEIGAIARRMGSASGRPVLAATAEAETLTETLEALYRARRAGYMRVSDAVVATDGRTADAVAARIAERLGADVGVRA